MSSTIGSDIPRMSRKTKLKGIATSFPLKMRCCYYSRYMELNSIEEFNTARAEAQSQLSSSKDAEHLPPGSPIYYDQETKKYYYPKLAITELHQLHRETLSGVIPLIFNADQNAYLHPENMEMYVEFHDPETFNQQREEYQLDLKDRIELATKTPIYKIEKTGKSYYPQIALREIEELNRDVIELEKNILSYDKKGKTFIHPATREKYVEVANSEEFLNLRMATQLTEKLESLGSQGKQVPDLLIPHVTLFKNTRPLPSHNSEIFALQFHNP